MAKKKVNKTQLIKNALAKNSKALPSEIAEGLGWSRESTRDAKCTGEAEVGLYGCVVLFWGGFLTTQKGCHRVG